MTFTRFLLICILHSSLAIGPGLVLSQDTDAPLRAGIIGLDTSHVPAFTKALNDPKATGARGRVQVVAGFPGGSPDIASSRDRVEGFTKQLQAMEIEIVDSIPALLAKVDVVLIESVDGRPHLEQALPVFRAKKRVFIDKPLAGSLVDVLAIAALAKKYDTPWFSSSSLRFSPGTYRFREDPSAIGKIHGAMTWGPCSLEPTHPDLFWYGVHGVESLFTIMGTGCQQVTRVHTPMTDQAVGVWEGGRQGTFYGMRSGKSGYGATVFGEKEIASVGSYAGYEPLVERIADFFVTGKPPIDPQETIEMFAFMAAADRSKVNGGAPVQIADVLAEARQQLPQRLAALGE